MSIKNAYHSVMLQQTQIQVPVLAIWISNGEFPRKRASRANKNTRSTVLQYLQLN